MSYRDPFDATDIVYNLPPGSSTFRLRTRRRNNIIGFLVRVAKPRFTILYSHGNAVRVGPACTSLNRLFIFIVESI